MPACDSGILKKWKQCEAVQASCGCLEGHVCMGVHISVFAPKLCNTSVSGLDDMQIDAEIKKEQIGTLFVWVGALEGGFGGWVVPPGCPPQKVYVPSKN